MVTRLKKSQFVEKVLKFTFRVLGEMIPKKKNLVVFESFMGKQYSDNPRAIYEHMASQDDGWDMYWSIRGELLEDFKGKPIQSVKRFSLRWFWLVFRAKYWVSNSRMPNWLQKPRKTIYLQTWHGTPLKRLGVDIEEVHMPGTTTEDYKESFVKEVRNWDYLIAPNPYSSQIFRQAFKFEGRMLDTGYPRNDVLYKNNTPEYISSLKHKLGIPSTKKVVLYAPTWRDNQYSSAGKYKFELPFDLEQLKNVHEEEIVILLRMHYLIAENFDLEKYKGFVYDFSNYEDIRDLYLVSDLLITDYSSTIFDYANLKRPVIFYAYDLVEYRDELRGFYLDYETEMPGPIVTDMVQLIKLLNEWKCGKITLIDSKFEDFYKRICKWESGKASQTVYTQVFKNKK